MSDPSDECPAGAQLTAKVLPFQSRGWQNYGRWIRGTTAHLRGQQEQARREEQQAAEREEVAAFFHAQRAASRADKEDDSQE